MDSTPRVAVADAAGRAYEEFEPKMESKPRSSGAVIAAERVYEEFEPKMEWDRELGVDTLRVLLPDFKKEQIKVQVSSSRVLRISGERQLSDNRWSCFLKEIPLSSNYNHKEISARYEKGILYVKHPKLIVPDDAELQENEQPPVESSTLDGKPPQEKAQQPGSVYFICCGTWDVCQESHQLVHQEI